MKLALVASLAVLLLGASPQRKSKPSSCDHAAPPAGMHWACAADDPCDCHLVPGGPGEDGLDQGGIPESPGAGVQCTACRISYFVVPSYPGEARKTHKEGSVSATLSVTPNGAVQEVRITSGDAELAKAAQAAFQQWRFAPGGRPESIPVRVKFVLSDNPAGSVTGTSLLDLVVTAKPI